MSGQLANDWTFAYICIMGKVLYVYKITNLVNGKKYIGKHSSLTVLNDYYGSGIAIKEAIKKYGKNCFEKIVLCTCDTEKELNEKEIFYIEKEGTFKNGYNMTKGGEGMLGHKQSEASRLKASLSRKQHYKNNPELAIKLSKLAKEKIGNKNPFFGKKLSQSHIDKLTIERVKAITGANNPSAVKLICIETKEIFLTAKDAAIFCGLKYSTTILKAAKGQRKKAGGYTWQIIK